MRINRKFLTDFILLLILLSIVIIVSFLFFKAEGVCFGITIFFLIFAYIVNKNKKVDKNDKNE